MKTKDMELEQKDLKLLFDSGVLVKGTVVPSPLSDKGDFNVLITHKDKSQILLVTARGEQRNFRTIQVAINVLEKIGFKKIEVQLP